MLEDERQLINKIADGDVKALGILYVLFSARIRNFAYSLLQSSTEAEDVTHDLFLKIWSTRANLREVTSLKSYLFSMTHNAVLNIIKRRSVSDKYRRSSVESLSEVYEPLSEMDTSELIKSIDAALEQMSLLRKTIFRMHRYEHKTYQEIADILMISPKTVQYHISCALAELRKLV